MDELLCSNCGWNVIEDGCGFIYSDNKIVSCQHCPESVAKCDTQPILISSENDKEIKDPDHYR